MRSQENARVSCSLLTSLTIEPEVHEAAAVAA